MALIAGAIEKKLHLCGDKNLESQTWNLFKEQRRERKLFVFGVGAGMDYFLRNCCNNIQIDGVVDNDIGKQGQKLGWCCAEAWNTQYEDIVIQKPEVLNLYSKKDIVVLVTSTNYYKTIVKQLRDMDVTNVFVLLMLENNSIEDLSEKREKEEFEKIRTDYVHWCCQQEIQSKKIVMSYGEYGGHAKSVTKELMKKSNALDIVWLVYDEKMDVPNGVRLVPLKNWKRYIYELETAQIWLFDVTVHSFIRKRPEQIYIQTKHWSSITLKKFYLDDISSCTSDDISSWIRYNGKIMDYLFSGSELDEISCRSGFAFEGEAIRVGSPRSDILFDCSIKEKVYQYFHLNKAAHVLLYAPTYRKKEVKEKKSFKISLDMDRLLRFLKLKFGGEWYIFVRLHPWLSFEKCGLNEDRNIINACNYPDSQELVAASDIMITDYSSIMFEAAYIKQPVFLFAPDRKEYIDKERGLLLDYDSLPFKVAETNEELFAHITNFSQEKYEKKLNAFMDLHGVKEDGHASERAAEFIFKLMNGEG